MSTLILKNPHSEEEDYQRQGVWVFQAGGSSCSNVFWKGNVLGVIVEYILTFFRNKFIEKTVIWSELEQCILIANSFQSIGDGLRGGKFIAELSGCPAGPRSNSGVQVNVSPTPTSLYSFFLSARQNDEIGSLEAEFTTTFPRVKYAFIVCCLLS